MTLYRLRTRTKLHLDPYCIRQGGGQNIEQLTLKATKISRGLFCSNCYAVAVANAIRQWPHCPATTYADPVLMVGHEHANYLPVQLHQLFERCANALGAQWASGEGTTGPRIAAVVPRALIEWLHDWAPLRAFQWQDTTLPVETPAVLALTAGLWQPYSQSMLADPNTALETARLIVASQLPS